MQNQTMHDVLYLASQSISRQKLLQTAGIPFSIMSHTSDEQESHVYESVHAYVLAIARSKMKTVILPKPSEVAREHLFVLTADTLIHTAKSGRMFGKPINKEDAKAMIAAVSAETIEVITGCCLEKMAVVHGEWKVVDQAHWTTSALIDYIIDPAFVDQYLDAEPLFLHACGGCVVEGMGQSFLKSVQGSYSTVLGLPLFELRAALKKMGFRF
jgi:septum formation protein